MKYGKLIELDKTTAKDVEFVARATGYDREGANFSLINVEKWDNEFAVIGCDGRRLHVAMLSEKDADLIELEIGMYVYIKSGKNRFLAQTKNPDLRYPNAQKVIPTDPPLFHTEICTDAGPSGYASMIQFFRSFPEPVGIQLHFINDLPCRTWDVYYRGNRKAVVFKSGNLKAAIMTIALDA